MFIYLFIEFCSEISVMGRQIVRASGPSGPNRDYLFHLEDALAEFGGSPARISTRVDLFLLV